MSTAQSESFRDYLRRQSESRLWNSEGDSEHSGIYYQTGAASCFFPVAARTLVKDGLDHDNVALFCVEGALEALTAGGLSRREAEEALLKIALSCRVTEELEKPQ